MDTKLTKDAEYMICALYKDYKEKRKRGDDKATAKFSGSAERIHKDLMSEWSFEDVDETCRELSRARFLSCQFADNVTWNSSLTDESIIYMENRFVNGLVDVLDYMAKIKAAIF